MSFIASKLCLNNSIFLWSKILTNTSYLPNRNYAARKGTRERKQKKKVKKEVEQKIKFIPHNQRKKDLLLANRAKLKHDDSWKSEPSDNVYNVKYFRWKIYPFAEALQNHRETHHPDIYNLPNANLLVRIELNMQGEKSTRFVDDFTRVVPILHKFDHGQERSIIAFSKATDVQKQALNAGAQLVGGVDLIKQIQNGAVSLQNFQYIVAHPDILPDLVALRGLMKRRFPNPKLGTLNVDLGEVTDKFMNGISYSAKKDEHEKDFGLVETVIGTLNMDSKHLEDNFAALVKDVNTMRPKREGHFISRCLLLSPPSREKFKVDHNLYIESKESSKTESPDEEEDEEVGERVTL